ncbi:5'/3'-nucleotidase SurE [Streptomyces sp. NPDC093060]|uniref:5'/3'-nucleotidase SurE n=1 Tax=Streptomyces sp. NPDC093060 TaxID=3366019 RepID=UPI00382DF673
MATAQSLRSLHRVRHPRARPGRLGGTNFGPNVGAMATRSGTVGAAMTAVEEGVTAIAVSTGGLEPPESTRILNAVRPTVDFAVRLIDRLRGRAHG